MPENWVEVYVYYHTYSECENVEGCLTIPESYLTKEAKDKVANAIIVSLLKNMVDEVYFFSTEEDFSAKLKKIGIEKFRIALISAMKETKGLRFKLRSYMPNPTIVILAKKEEGITLAKFEGIDIPKDSLPVKEIVEYFIRKYGVKKILNMEFKLLVDETEKLMQEIFGGIKIT